MAGKPNIAGYATRRARRILCAGAGLLLAAWGGAAAAQVLEIGSDGSVATFAGPTLYSSEGARPLTPAAPVRAAATRPAAAPVEVADAMRRSAARYGLSPRLVEAVAWRESGFRQTASSPKGATGVMQLMPATARALGVDAADMAANVDGGAAYLAQMLRRFDGDLVRALAAYNAGPEAVAKFGGPPPYPETRAYVNAILERLARVGLDGAAFGAGR